MMLRNELHGLERLIAVIDPSTEERSSPVMGDLAGMVEQTVGEIAVIADALEWTAQQIRWADGECR